MKARSTGEVFFHNAKYNKTELTYEEACKTAKSLLRETAGTASNQAAERPQMNTTLPSVTDKQWMIIDEGKGLVSPYSTPHMRRLYTDIQKLGRVMLVKKYDWEKTYNVHELFDNKEDVFKKEPKIPEAKKEE